VGIEGENSERSIIRCRSDVSGFSRGTKNLDEIEGLEIGMLPAGNEAL
jgi:hypothetical protein